MDDDTPPDTVELDTADGPMPALAAAPPPGSPVRGAVVVVQEAFGLTGHIGRVCTRLADAGYRALAPAFFHRQGSPVFAYDDFEGLLPVMGTLDRPGVTADLTAALDHLAAEGHPAGNCAVVGFCMGGTLALYAGTLAPLGAAVTYYGGGVVEGRFGLPPLVELAPALQAPWLGQFGDLDKGIPPDQVEALRQAASTARVPTEVVRYADADHGFNCDERPSHHPASAAAAWARTLEWLDRHLAPAP